MVPPVFHVSPTPAPVDEWDWNAIDISNWTGPLDRNTVACWYDAHHVRRAIVGTQVSGITIGQVSQLQAAGIKCELYVFLYWDDFDAERVEEATTLANILGITRVWVDVEWGTTFVGDATIATACKLIQNYGLEAGIYTSKSKWLTLTHNSYTFWRLPLWDAYYDGDPGPNFQDHPYGGWIQATIEQYRGDTSVCGKSVDLNWHSGE